MLSTGPGKCLKIYLGESDSWRGQSLYMSILQTLRKGGIAGTTVTRALAGFGSHSRIHSNSVEVMSMDLPIIITAIDSSENIEKALALVCPMVREGLITVQDIEIVMYGHREAYKLPVNRLVSDIMTRNVTTVNMETPVLEVVELLMGKLLKAVPVVDENNRVVGIITNGDLLQKAGLPTRLAVGERLKADDLRDFLAQVSSDKLAQNIMSTPVVTAHAEEPLNQVVRRLIERGLKRMPVVNGYGKLVGMVSRLDILRAVAGSATGQQEKAPAPAPGHTLGEVMSSDVPIVHVNDDLVDVLKKMLEADIKRVVVLDEQQRAVGIITDGDLVARVGPAQRRNVLRALAARVTGSSLQRGNVTARDLMSQQVLSAPQDTSIVAAISLMLSEGRKRLVVVDEKGHPIGIVDRQTLLAASLSQ